MWNLKNVFLFFVGCRIPNADDTEDLCSIPENSENFKSEGTTYHHVPPEMFQCYILRDVNCTMFQTTYICLTLFSNDFILLIIQLTMHTKIGILNKLKLTLDRTKCYSHLFDQFLNMLLQNGTVVLRLTWRDQEKLNASRIVTGSPILATIESLYTETAGNLVSVDIIILS